VVELNALYRKGHLAEEGSIRHTNDQVHEEVSHNMSFAPTRTSPKSNGTAQNNTTGTTGQDYGDGFNSMDTVSANRSHGFYDTRSAIDGDALLDRVAGLDISGLQATVSQQIARRSNPRYQADVEYAQPPSNRPQHSKGQSVEEQLSIQSQPQQLRTSKYKMPVVKPRPKKSDPVSLFHAHQATWRKDSFLSRNGPATGGGVVVRESRYGGLATTKRF
jgi:hypothetical protein